ncbi:IS891/IS1136/IS1341 transposase [Scytonema sp. HK-05]|uniref:RNA-guided endonuclease InsQ/TnpB family protein n=1 Tax=Scytonema sp. HK-05 TaxID=1137095 RepID=UPI0009379650|nr:RNA-guided endonuclease TnpB family protein [Scytonema sp. HK-05]OKH55423.1 transposase [Scytonema sp. HK-05]BAY47157.1 IS891/IS1136/IS1341 transposase [Scytonema sp. HK-05]
MLVLEYKAVCNHRQSKAINEAIRTSQFVRNKVLRYWMDNRGVGKKELYQYNTQLRAEYKFVNELNSHATHASVENVERAINRFFDNCKKNKPGKKGYPRFKKDVRSVEYKTSGWKLHPTKRRITFSDKKGIGQLKLLGKWDIHTYPLDLIKRVRIVRRADGYYVQFCVKVDITPEPRSGNGEVGLDVGLEYFYSDSNGYHQENPRFLRKAEKAIKHAQRRIYRKEKGKNNRRKAIRRYARKHLRVSRQREEHAKRLARCVCKANAFVAYEDLNVKGLVKNRRLAKSISDVAWSAFRRWIEYFAIKFRTEVVAVAPHYTSQECSGCGSVVKKALSTRTHTCKCGCVLQRDVNAAINILLKAKSTGGQAGSNAWGVGTSTLVGATLLEQVATLSQESPCL